MHPPFQFIAQHQNDEQVGSMKWSLANICWELVDNDNVFLFQLIDVLETDEVYEQTGLSDKLEHVLKMMPESAKEESRYAYQNDVIVEEDEEEA